MISSKIVMKGDSKTLKTYLEAIKPDSEEDFGRSTYTVSKGLTGLVIKVKSEDVTSFRAAMNAILAAMTVIDKTIQQTSDRSSE